MILVFLLHSGIGFVILGLFDHGTAQTGKGTDLVTRTSLAGEIP
jgi:hypothetical protein